MYNIVILLGTYTSLYISNNITRFIDLKQAAISGTWDISPDGSFYARPRASNSQWSVFSVTEDLLRCLVWLGWQERSRETPSPLIPQVPVQSGAASLCFAWLSDSTACMSEACKPGKEVECPCIPKTNSVDT